MEQSLILCELSYFSGTVHHEHQVIISGVITFGRQHFEGHCMLSPETSSSTGKVLESKQTRINIFSLLSDIST